MTRGRLRSTFDGGAGDVGDAVATDGRETIREGGLVGEDRQLVAVDDVQVEEVGVQEARRSGRGHHGTGIECLHVTQCARELALDLEVDQLAHRLGGLLVHHRIPNGAGELEPVLIDGSVRTQGVQVARSTVVLIHDAMHPVADDEGRVTGRAVRDGCFDVDGDREFVSQVGFDSVLGVNEGVETQRTQTTLEFVGREAGKQNRGVPRDVLAQPLLVEMVSVKVGDVEVRRMQDFVPQRMGELVVAGEHEPRPEERRVEPRVTKNRSLARLNEDAGVADGGGSHRGCTHDDNLPIHVRTTKWTMVTGSGGRCTARHPATRARSTSCRPNSGTRSDPRDPCTSRPEPRVWRPHWTPPASR